MQELQTLSSGQVHGELSGNVLFSHGKTSMFEVGWLEEIRNCAWVLHVKRSPAAQARSVVTEGVTVSTEAGGHWVSSMQLLVDCAKDSG